MVEKKGTGRKRSQGFPLRFNKDEMKIFRRKAKDAGLTRADYARCLILEIPFSALGGKDRPGRPKKPTASETA